ncbi:TPA: hypothetical protein SMI48_002240 [Serratia marcescens]|nr:hypothetical protein [Serratia marcescens]
MRTIFNTRFNLPYEDVIDPRIPLITDSLLAGYDCLTNLDFSGRGNNFSYGGGFNNQGAILANNAAHVIQTPVIEQDEMTVIGCWNIAAPNAAASLVNNMDVSDPLAFRGNRIIRLDTNVGQIDVATGIANPTLTSMPTGVAGAWTIRAWSWNNSTLREIFHSGAIANTRTLSDGRAKNIARGFSVNGVPAGVPGGSITAGTDGTLGFMLFYNEFIDPAVAKSRMDIVADIMLRRGVVVP